jgi:hypothetical protein
MGALSLLKEVQQPTLKATDLVDTGSLGVKEVGDAPLLNRRREGDGKSLDIPLEEMRNAHPSFQHADH